VKFIPLSAPVGILAHRIKGITGCGGWKMEYNYQHSQGIALDAAHQYGRPEQLLVRELMAEEIGSVIGYLECAELLRDHRMAKTFRKIANEELSHFASLLQLLTGLDQEQAAEMKKQDMAILTAATESFCPFHGTKTSFRYPRGESKREIHPDDPVWDILRNAIRDELYAINAYQKQLETASIPAVQGVLAHLRRQEKEHFVTFTQLFYEVYGLDRDSLVLTD